MGFLVWVVVAIALAIGEVLTPGLFFLGPVALAAGAAAVADLLGAGTIGSVIVFLVGALLSLAFLRPATVTIPASQVEAAHDPWYFERLLSAWTTQSTWSAQP